MSVRVQRPLVLTGISLVAGAWLLEWVHPLSFGWGETALWGAVALGAGSWLLQRKRLKLDPQPSVVALNRETVERSLNQIDTLIVRLQAEPVDTAAIATSLQTQRAQLQTELDRKTMKVAIAGGHAVGKTTLMAQLAEQAASQSAAVIFEEVALGNVNAGSVNAVDSDLVLFLVMGDLTDSDLQVLQKLANQQRLLLVFNKQDQYLPPDRPLLLQQLRERVRQVLPLQDVVAIAAAPAPYKVRQHQADGTIQERLEQPAADLVALSERLNDLQLNHSTDLILATVNRQVEALRATVRAELNRVRRDRALPLIEQSQWIAAATAFATPLPSLDLVATAAINAQLVKNLGDIYQQSFSLEREQTFAATLGELVVKLGLVEISSQAIAPLLKSHALTYVAGGLLQGISAAYWTRVAGLALVEYFEETDALDLPQSSLQLDRLAQKLKAVFQDNRRTAFVQSLVKQSLDRLVPSLTVEPTVSA